MATLVNPPSSNVPKGWTIGLWILQVGLAALFGMAGFMKATAPLARLSENMAWVGGAPGALVRFIGVSELLGAIGLILPAATRIKPVLTPLAAVGLVVVMAFAAALHVSRGEIDAIALNFILGGAAALLAWGRFSKAPIQPK